MAAAPLFLSPALPSELLAWITQNGSHPTTLIICSSRADFLSSLVQDARRSEAITDIEDDPEGSLSQRVLLSSPLYQVAVARHIRLVFTPTVSHLRAYLSVFDPADSRAPPPPPADSVYSVPPSRAERQPLLLVYGFLQQHRDTSEWSAQGINATAAVLVEAGRRCGFRVVLVDVPRETVGGGAEAGEGRMQEDAGAGSGQSVLDEEVPILSASTVRAAGDRDDAVWTGRKVTLGRVLGRWFRHREGGWKTPRHETLNDLHDDGNASKEQQQQHMYGL